MPARRWRAIETNSVINCDVMESLAQIPDDSIALVLTDPPYNIGKAAWDTIDNYVDWCGRWIAECERVLKPNGILAFWHNDIVQTSKIICWVDDNTSFRFNSFGLWHKPYHRRMAWSNVKESSSLRSFFNIFEWFVAFEMSEDKDHTGLERVLSNPTCFASLKCWYAGELERLGLTNKDVAQAYIAATGKKPYMLRHYFQNSQFDIPTQEVWEKVYEPLGFNKKYSALRAEYEALRPPFNKLSGEPYSNYFRDPEEKQKNGKRLPHPCMKPLTILEKLIQTYSNPGDIVLDCFLGSGQTAIAAEKHGRKWIGIEKDATYCKLAAQRIAEAREVKS